MLYKDKIREIHIEITNRCNSSCPMCPRNINGGPLNPALPLSEITFDDILKLCPLDSLKEFRHIYFAGAYGDPIMANDLLEILKYFRHNAPHIRLGIYTNASARSQQWWQELGEILSQDDDYCIFSIDGLRDSNSIYRRGTEWGHIMNSANSFIGAGGKAIWEYLVFKHNEHDLEQAKDLAKSMGFQQFIEKYSGRFNRAVGATSLGWHNAHPVYDQKGKFEYLIEPAFKVSQKKTNYSSKEVFSIFHPEINTPKNNQTIPPHTMKDEYAAIKEPVINCKAQNELKVYLAATGHIYPCSWLGYHLHRYDETAETHYIKKVFTSEVLESLCIRKHSLEEILAHDIFQKTITQSWKAQTPEQGRLSTCIGECGSRSDDCSRSLKNKIVYQFQ